MKKLLLVLLLLSVAFPGYSKRTTISGNVTDECTFEGVTVRRTKEQYSTTIYNIRNTKGDAPYVLQDGSPAPGYYEDYFVEGVTSLGFDRAMRMAFTPAEQAEYGMTREHVLIFLVYSNTGKVLEVDFIIDSDSPLRDIPLQKFILWHNYIKKYVTAKVTDPETKRLQFVHGVMYYFFPAR